MTSQEAQLGTKIFFKNNVFINLFIDTMLVLV